MGVLHFWSGFCHDRAVVAKEAAREALVTRVNKLGEMMEALEALKCYHWMTRYLPTLTDAAQKIKNCDVTEAIWQRLQNVVAVSDMFCIAMLCYSTLVVGDEVNLEEFLLAQELIFYPPSPQPLRLINTHCNPLRNNPELPDPDPGHGGLVRSNAIWNQGDRRCKATIP